VRWFSDEPSVRRARGVVASARGFVDAPAYLFSFHGVVSPRGGPRRSPDALGSQRPRRARAPLLQHVAPRGGDARTDGRRDRRPGPPPPRPPRRLRRLRERLHRRAGHPGHPVLRRPGEARSTRQLQRGPRLRLHAGAAGTGQNTFNAQATSGYLFEIPVGVGAGWRFRRPWELLFEVQGRIGFASSGDYFSADGRPGTAAGVASPGAIIGTDVFALMATVGIGLDD
jgi:hypothetical protein